MEKRFWSFIKKLKAKVKLPKDFFFSKWIVYKLKLDAFGLLDQISYSGLPNYTKKYTLLVGLYPETSKARLLELEYCIRKNIRNPLISSVVIFFEKRPQASFSVSFQSLLRSKKIKIIDVDQRSTYEELIAYANKNLTGQRVIVANTDIFFDASLKEIAELNLKGLVLALTRYNLFPYKDYKGYRWKRNPSSQDSWIFEAPLPPFKSDIFMGWRGCDNWIAFEMARVGLKLLNPSQTLRTWHLQAKVDKFSDGTPTRGGNYHSEIRHSSGQFVKAKFLPIQELKDCEAQMSKTKCKRIDFPLDSSATQFPQYVLELENVYVCEGLVVLDSDFNPIEEAIQREKMSWNSDYQKLFEKILENARLGGEIVNLEKGVNYIQCLNYAYHYPYGHLWDQIQPLKKIEALNLSNSKLLINRDTGHTKELYRHFEIFGYGSEDLQVLHFNNKKPGSIIYFVPKLYYSSAPIGLAHWAPNTAKWMQQKYTKGVKSASKRIYLSRNSIKKRGVLNELEVIKFLRAYDFEILDGALSLFQSIEMFSGAEIVVFPHGSAFKNTLFSLGNPLILEFCPENRPNHSFVQNSRAIGHNNHKQFKVPADKNFNIRIDLRLLEDEVLKFVGGCLKTHDSIGRMSDNFV